MDLMSEGIKSLGHVRGPMSKFWGEQDLPEITCKSLSVYEYVCFSDSAVHVFHHLFPALSDNTFC